MGHMTLFRVYATFASSSRQLRELVPLARGEAPPSCLPVFLSATPFLPPWRGNLPCAAWSWPLSWCVIGLGNPLPLTALASCSPTTDLKTTSAHSPMGMIREWAKERRLASVSCLGSAMPNGNDPPILPRMS